MNLDRRKGFVLLSTLSLLFFVGLALLSNTRALTSSLLWQVHLTEKRSQLDWELESALNCLAMSVVSPTKFDTEACGTDVGVTFSVTKSSQENHYQLSAFKAEAVTRAELKLGDLSRNIAVLSRSSILGALSSTSSLTTQTPLALFTGYSAMSDLKSRVQRQLEIDDPNVCGAQLVSALSEGHHALWIDGDCQISLGEWNVLASASQIEPLALFFVEGKLLIEGTETLHGLLAMTYRDGIESPASGVDSEGWAVFSLHDPNLAIPNDTSVQLLATPHIVGGVIFDRPSSTVFIHDSASVTENEGVLMRTRFMVAKRGWVKGSWRDF